VVGDIADLRQRLLAVPFSRLMGMRVVEADAESVTAELPSSPEILNHVGTTHAAAQFGLGEGAVGALALMAFPDLLAAGAVPLLAEATVAYRRPASGTLRARAVLSVAEQQRIRAEFAANGKARYTVPVDLVDQSGTVATTLQVTFAIIIPRTSNQ
jgi:acyl-coenzyme A thioesterase PaaI-like protein